MSAVTPPKNFFSANRIWTLIAATAVAGVVLRKANAANKVDPAKRDLMEKVLAYIATDADPYAKKA